MGAVDPKPWQRQARCTEADTNVFFSPETEKLAKGICGLCPVRKPCLDYALETQQPDGVWGGKNTGERQALLRKVTVTPGGAPLVAVTYSTRARSTGALCTAGRTATGWGVACLTHDTTGSSRTKADAEHAVSRPHEWCPNCTRIAAGSLPRASS